MSRSLKFANRLAGELRGASVEAGGCSHYRVTGRLEVTAATVGVEIHVWQSFRHLKSVPPAVWCREPWVKAGAEWHNRPSTGFCWILPNEWRDAMT